MKSLLLFFGLVALTAAFLSYGRPLLRRAGVLCVGLTTFAAGYLLTGSVWVGLACASGWLLLPWVEILLRVRKLRLPLGRQLRQAAPPAGALEVQNNNGLGATAGSTTVNDGAQLRFYTGGSGLTVAENIGISGTGSGGAILSTGGNNALTGTITLAANSRIGADTTGGAGSLSVSNVTGGSNVLFIGANGANIEIKGALSGGGASQDSTTTSLYKDGANALTLSGNNTYSGDTRVSAGNLTVASGGNLGDGTSDVYIAKDASVTINTSTTVSSMREWGTTNGGTASIGSGATLTVSGDGYEAYQNSISGAGALTKSGSGTLGLYGTQGYTGKTTVNAGLLKTQNDIVGMASTNIEVTGGTFQTQSANVLSDSAAVTVAGGTFTVGGNDTVGSFDMSSGELSGSGKLTASTYTLSGGTVTANLGAGTLNSSGTSYLNGTEDATTVNVGGGTLYLGSAGRLAAGAAVTVSNSGRINLGGNEAVSSFELNNGTISGSGTLTASTYTLSGGTINAATTLGAGTATASTGTTALNGLLNGNLVVSGGTVNLGSADRIGNSSAVSISDGTLGLSSYSDTVGSFAMSGGVLSGTGGATLTAATYAISGAGDTTVNANLGAGALTKTGAGTLLIGNNKTAAVTTSSIEGGKLVVSGVLSGTTTITNSATIGGSGTVGTLNIASGGTLAPGNSPGTLTVTNGTSWAQGGSYDWEIYSLTDNPGSSWDWLRVTGGTLDLTGITSANGFTINLITLAAGYNPGLLANFDPTATYTNWLIASAPTISGFESGDFTLNTTGFANPYTGTFAIKQDVYGTGQGLFLTYTGGAQPVPEPGTWAAAALLAGAAGLVGWRRRKTQA